MMNIFTKHFSRKKQDKRNSLGQGHTSISADNSPLRRERPTSQCLNIAPRTSAYRDERKQKEIPKEWECGLCKKQLVEPRVLGCLHSFCTRCLQGLHQEGEAEVWSEVDRGSIQLDHGEHSGGSAGSGYESDPRNSGSEGSWEKSLKYGIFTRKISGKSVQFLLCPSCGYETPLPLGGVSALPLNYMLVRKMADEETASVLCDLCNTDIKAESRCNQCLVSVCTACGEAHHRQKATARHSLHPLDPLPARYCNQHPRAELAVYCATCQQVVCRDCCIISHSGHALANASRSAGERARLLRDACERARRVPDNVRAATRNMNAQAFEQDSQASRVESEVQTWAEEYRRAVDAHSRSLCTAAARARVRYQQRVDARNRELDDRAAQAVEAVKFAEELLAEAREDELLSLSGSVLRRLERLTELQTLSEAPRLELRFAATAPAQHNSTLVGRLLTTAPDADKCVLNTEGLQDLRVDCRHDAVFELRDNSGERIWCGGEQVAGFFRRQDSSARPDAARVRDRGDGRYDISLTPASPGAYLLAVTLNNKPIKGSPFPCAVRVTQPHTGRYHCCAFCSSGGKRNAVCACGGTMPGGYKGCGHGHSGWPGARHWSCCGSTARAAPCRPPTHRDQLYQFSL
ncbi:E3 ubiquitin-protein ligase TRIM45 isoform X2 [Plodia interpunctella]|uniref:E3 ubiquitin-protein ligase TRIM45 isoform X2 n=1 Tax=Plodia interpunctella TaxID=58824 RepID=UPI0023675E18|nr:tripartite motif-containing protein 45 isoform X2 [Plodia interpunctella]